MTVAISNSCAGCTDSYACNYDSEATIDDDSCDFNHVLEGISSSVVCNYDETAIPDDGSCGFLMLRVHRLFGLHHDSNATVDDDSCEFPIAWLPPSFSLQLRRNGNH